jgi:hypothetical protein
MNGAIARLGLTAPQRLSVPLVRPLEISATNEPTFVIYDRIPELQAYRWSGR